MDIQEILPKLKALVGYERHYSDSYPIEEGMIRRFAEAIGDNNPLYCDREFARQTPYGGTVAPPTFVFEWNHQEAVRFDETGAYIGDLALPERVIRGGNNLQFFQPLVPGDIITTASRINDVYEKRGKSGNLIFIICDSTYTNQHAELLAKQRSTYICLP